jgi:hypothetical protein
LPNGSVGTAYTGYLSAAGGTPPYHWTAMGLPAGLTLSGSTISGTPTTSFAGQVSVTVTDSATTPAMATASLPLTITAPVITTGLPSFAYPIP